MKRSPLTRKTALKPVSEKKRALDADDRRRVAEQGQAFRRAISGVRCVVCGRTDGEAWRATGFGHQAHHAVRQEVLRRLGLRELLWDARNAVCVCEEPCHRRHSQRISRIPFSALPAAVLEFAREHGLQRELEQEYPS